MYVIASVNNNYGEHNSIYVSIACRKRQLSRISAADCIIYINKKNAITYVPVMCVVFTL